METCLQLWKEGMEVEPWNHKWNSYFKDSFNCMLKTETGHYVLLRAPKSIEHFVHSIHTYSASTMGDGLFTWILYSTLVDSRIRFASSRVYSAFEVGVSHRVLALRVGAYKIHGAGELQKQGSSIQLNTESGTYTCNWLESRLQKPSCSCAQLESLIEDRVRSFLKQFTITMHKGSFISKKTPVSQEELKLYRNAGFTVSEFADSASCKQALKQKAGHRRKTKKHNLSVGPRK